MIYQMAPFSITLYPFVMEKLEWSGYPTVKSFDDMLSHFNKIPVLTDEWTDRRLAMS